MGSARDQPACCQLPARPCGSCSQRCKSDMKVRDQPACCQLPARPCGSCSQSCKSDMKVRDQPACCQLDHAAAAIYQNFSSDMKVRDQPAFSKTMRQLLSELQIRHEGKGSAILLSAASKTMRQLLSELQIRHKGKLWHCFDYTVIQSRMF